MLRKNPIIKLETSASVKQLGQAKRDRFAIIASQYNARYVNAMLRAARRKLREAGVAKVQVVRVPGAFEIPVVAARLASQTGSNGLAAIVCLGVILRGQTTHAQFIGESVTHCLAHLQLQYHVPVIHEVLLLENEEQAKVRCLDRDHNRGEEAASTALIMARVMAGL